MDLLLSLPIASYLLAPSLTSWSTSLNLLFFYMTWTTLVLSHPPLRVHLTGLAAIRLAGSLLPSLLSLLLDAGVPSLAEGIKFGGRRSLPPRDARALARMALLAVVNLLILTGVEGAASWAFLKVFGEPEFWTTTTLPLPWQIARHILILLTAREVLVYYIHRFVLHGSSFIARLHNSYAHSRAAAPFSLLLLADHPLPLILHRLVPLYIPAILLRPHLLTYLLAAAVCNLEDTLATSGYSAVPGIILGGIVRRSAVHYASRGRANFGTWGILDWIHGTGRGRDVFDDLKDEADKHRVKQRSAKKAQRSVGKLRESVESWTGSDGDYTTPRRSTRKRTPRARN
jgi:hypothetical protein